MRSRAAAVALGSALLAVASCTPEPPPAVPTVALQSASSPPPAPPAPPVAPVDTTLPAGAAVLASVDLGKIGSQDLLAALRLLQGSLAKSVEQALELPADGSGPDWRVAAGLDGSRPLAFAELGGSPEEVRALEPLRKLVPAKDPQGNVTIPGGYAAIHAALAQVGTSMRGRLLVPVVDAPRAKKVIRALLRSAGLGADGSDAFGVGRLRVALGGDAATVVVDFAVGHGSRGVREAVAALQARPPGAPHDDPPPLEGRTGRLRYSPPALADQGFAAGLVAVDGALSGDAVDPGQKERIAAQGLWEAGQVYTLAGTAKGAYFTSVELSTRIGDKPEIVLSTEPGPGFVAPPDEAWKTSTSIAVGVPVWHAYDVSQAFARAWVLPGETEGFGGDVRHFVNLVHAAGWFAYPITVPSGPMALLSVERVHPPVFASPTPMRRFERVGGFLPDVNGRAGTKVFFGLLPEGTRRAVAECALAESAPCRGGLKVDQTVEKAGAFVRLAAVEKRFVLLVGGDRASVEVKLGLRQVGPFHVESPPVAALFVDRRSDLPVGEHLVGTVERRGTAIVWRLGSP